MWTISLNKRTSNSILLVNSIEKKARIEYKKPKNEAFRKVSRRLYFVVMQQNFEIRTKPRDLRFWLSITNSVEMSI